MCSFDVVTWMIGKRDGVGDTRGRYQARSRTGEITVGLSRCTRRRSAHRHPQHPARWRHPHRKAHHAAAELLRRGAGTHRVPARPVRTARAQPGCGEIHDDLPRGGGPEVQHGADRLTPADHPGAAVRPGPRPAASAVRNDRRDPPMRGVPAVHARRAASERAAPATQPRRAVKISETEQPRSQSAPSVPLPRTPTPRRSATTDRPSRRRRPEVGRPRRSCTRAGCGRSYARRRWWRST